jgi:hypothetical protein
LAINHDALLNRKQSGMFLGVSPNLVGMWKTLGKLTPAAHDKRGNPLYRVGDLLDVDREARASDKSHRGPQVYAA